ncbi:RidA family protein [Microbacterium sp. 179-I 3D3 NHS]|uniref:RidA family protein n=1 Tax=unclassified Microbacterium TaxID=2609290 RepID=UPI0039A03CD7
MTVTPVPLHTHRAPAPVGHYAQGLRIGGLLALSGQVGIDATTGSLADGVAAQTAQTLRNLEAVLRSAGLDLTAVVKTTCFLVDLSSFAEFDRAYGEVFGDHRPARSTIAVGLARDYLVEIEALAVVPD